MSDASVSANSEQVCEKCGLPHPTDKHEVIFSSLSAAVRKAKEKLGLK